MYKLNELYKNFLLNLSLLLTLIYYDLRLKYKDTLIGLWWALLHPLFLLTIYFIIFGLIFEPRWDTISGKNEYILILFVGLSFYVFCSDILNRSCILFKSNSFYLKKIKFPIGILPIVPIGSAFVNLIFCILLMIILFMTTSFSFNFNFFIIPLIIIPFLFFMVGISIIVATVGVILPDLTHVVFFINSLILFFCPIFYPLHFVPDYLKFLIYLNPLTFPISEIHNIIIQGSSPSFYYLLIYYLTSLLILITSVWILKKARYSLSEFV